MIVSCDWCSIWGDIDALDGKFWFCHSCRERIRQAMLSGLNKKRSWDEVILKCRDCRTFVIRKTRRGFAVCDECKTKREREYNKKQNYKKKLKMRERRAKEKLSTESFDTL